MRIDALKQQLLAENLSLTVYFALYADPLQSAPEIKDLHNKVAARALHKWKRLGTQLNIDYLKLTSIEEKHKDAFDCYAELFQLWKSKGDPPFTWGTIIDALTAPSVEEIELATQLQDSLQHT